jgi:hypothetical protein
MKLSTSLAAAFVTIWGAVMASLPAPSPGDTCPGGGTSISIQRAAAGWGCNKVGDKCDSVCPPVYYTEYYEEYVDDVTETWTTPSGVTSGAFGQHTIFHARVEKFVNSFSEPRSYCGDDSLYLQDPCFLSCYNSGLSCTATNDGGACAYSGGSRTVIPIQVGQQSGGRRTEFRRMSDSNPVAAGQ